MDKICDTWLTLYCKPQKYNENVHIYPLYPLFRGKRLTFLYTSPYEHVEYDVSGPKIGYFCL